MSRLTVNDLDKVAYDAWELCGMDADCTADCEGCFVNAIYLKLAHYEDLEEQGRLIEQKHGYWTGPDGYDCSECGENYMEVADADAYASGWKPNYCPNCGAKLAELKGTEE